MRGRQTSSDDHDSLHRLTLTAYGVRGSMPVAEREYMRYGGNTSSYTLRTKEGSLLFFDAGSGVRKAAQRELVDTTSPPAKIYLLFSHTHADHIEGLGMSKLPFLSYDPRLKEKKITLIGQPDLEARLRQYYSKNIWPIDISPRYMPAFDYEGIIE